MFGVPGPLGAKLGNFELGGGGPMYAIVYPGFGPRTRAPGRPKAGPGWVNYSIHGPPTPPTQNSQIWPPTAPGPKNLIPRVRFVKILPGGRSGI